MRTRSFTIVVAFVVLASCATWMLRTQPAPPATDRHTPNLDRPTQLRTQLIGTLRGRDFTLHYYAGKRFALETPTGKVLARDLTASTLGEQFPEISRMVESALADNRDGPRPFGPLSVTLLADSDTLLADSE